MKLLLITLCSFLCLGAHANIKDTLFSTYFRHTDFNYHPKVNGVDQKFYGTYSLLSNKHNQVRISAGDQIKIDQSGIYIEKNKLQSIKRETVRENSKYTVKNNYLHGIIANDSIPVFIENETYYFLIPRKFYLHNYSESTVLRKINTDTYLIFNSEENDYFSVTKINFKNNELILSELNILYQDVVNIIHKKITENGIPTFILSPSQSNWNILLKAFSVYDQYMK